MSEVLVIHPNDPTTEFLKYIYKDKNYDIVDNDIYSLPIFEMRIILKREIMAHDKILIMGHGTPYGLLNPSPKRQSLFIIDDSFAEELSKKEVVSIWCFSDQYFKRNLIYKNQFHSGMIISEVPEAFYTIGYSPLTKEQLLENMESFAKIVGECIEDTPEEMQKHILEKYNYKDEITQFNRKNILVF